MPAGALTMVPLPKSTTVSAYCPAGTLVNSALTLMLLVIERSQTFVPVHAPAQPVKRKPGLGVATTLTCVPSANPATQVVPQLMPPGTVVTVPPTPPDTVSVT